MGKSGAKGARAIPVPHDGPIFHYFLQKDKERECERQCECGTVGIEEALELLNRLKRYHGCNESESNSKHESRNEQFWRTLFDAAQISSQLHALQAYRSSLIHRPKGVESSDPQQQQLELEGEGEEKENAATMMGTYRLLLEWSISVNTTPTIRRAIHSSLDALAPFVPNHFELIEQVVSSVLNNENNGNDNNNKWWQTPVGTLFEILSYQPMRRLILQDGGALVNTTNNSNCTKALKLLQCAAQQLQPVLEQYSFQNINNNTLPSSCTLAVPILFGKHVVETVEQSLNIANTLKHILTTILSQLDDINHGVGVGAAAGTSNKRDAGDLYSSSSSPSCTQRANTNAKDDIFVTVMSQLESFLWQVIVCRVTHVDGLSITGVAYAQTLTYRWNRANTIHPAPMRAERIAAQAAAVIQDLQHVTPAVVATTIQHDESSSSPQLLIPPLNVLCVVQGIAATLQNHVLVCRGSYSSATQTAPILISPLASHLLEQCRHSTDSAVRLSALRGFNTLLSRCHTILNSTHPEFAHHAKDLTQDALEICLQTWENPPGRQVENAIPSLFGSLISLLQVLTAGTTKEKEEEMTIEYNASGGKHDNNATGSGSVSGSATFNDVSSLNALVCRVLAQPLNRKGRYLALEILLPVLGAKKLLDIGGDELVASLVSGIGDRSHNAGAISDLLGKLLARLREEMNADAGVVDITKSLNKKQRRKLEKEIARGKTEAIQHNESIESDLFPEWIAQWAPHIARALLSSSSSRQKQVAAFCIPLMVTMVGGSTHRTEASYAFAALLNELQVQYKLLSISGVEHFESYASNYETSSDRFLWAKLEVARQASLQKLTITTTFTSRLRSSLAQNLPKKAVVSSLTHSMASIRAVAFASLEAVIPAYNSSATPLQNIEAELVVWRKALPYAFKSGAGEYVPKLLKQLSNLLTRTSVLEAEHYAVGSMNVGSISISRDAMQVDYIEVSPLPLLSSFVCDFLITDVALKQAAYPGTVAEKEQFVLPLLQCILSFASQHGEIVSTNNKPRGKSGSMLQRRLQPSQVATNDQIILELLSMEVFAALLSLLDSAWDNTRAAAYDLICNLVRQAHAQKLSLPSAISSPGSRQYLEARAVHLASSPRQREADTGARMLAFLYGSLAFPDYRMSFLRKIVHLTIDRIAMMEKGLSLVLSTGAQECQSNCDSQMTDGRDLPLAHGLIHTLRLIVEFGVSSGNDHEEESSTKAVFGLMACVCCRSIEVSLSVVADVKDDEASDSLESNIRQDQSTPSGQTPLNINTGTIGANGMFSSVKVVDKDETIRVLAMQRVIVGSWLLTKEACATLATIVTAHHFRASLPLIRKTGSLLISTLTSLKHQGAAFAAHKALQKIASSCSSDAATIQFPSEWAQRLLHEISSTEKVRDSTLRRSTGYGLGFLGIMRSEPPSSVAPRTLCPYVLAHILKLSLPPEGEMELFLERFDFDTSGAKTSPFSYPSCLGTISSSRLYIRDKNYESRSRVHALNILRLIILDAPLASEVSKFIGDAIMSAILGYNDPAWDVRNSSTMVFAAAMLRVVDADKNANRKDVTSGNAITANELFRTYPVLAPFLISVMQEGVDDMHNTCSANVQASSSRFIHPPLYPILLLLSRLQPVSGTDATEVTEPFVKIVLQSLKHRHHKVRIVAARALANICSGETNRASSRSHLLGCCLLILEGFDSSGWNARHGALLGIQALLLLTLDPSSYLINKNLFSQLCYYASWWHATCKCPPSCVSAALETLYDAASRSGKIVPEDVLKQTEQASWTVISRIEAVCKLTDKMDIVGVARLGAVASRVACKSSLDVVWNPQTEENVRGIHLERLERLLKSNSIDVRLESMKEFKKPIYDAIDNMMNAKNANKYQRTNTLVQISRTLQSCLFHEVHRSSSVDSKENPTHPPTVRRMSRCLLECVYAYKSLAKREHDEIGFSALISVEDGWKTALKMINLDKDELPQSSSQFDTENSLTGNSVELMALCICTLLKRIIQNNTRHDILTKTRVFASAIVQLNNPLSSWRLRYSAALALETCQMLHYRPATIETKTKIWESELQQKQSDLYITALKLFQDSDQDVRLVAGRAVAQPSVATLSTVQVSDASPASVPLLSLEHTYKSINDQFLGINCANLLLSSVLDDLKDLEGHTNAFVKEMSRSEDARSPEELLNLSTDRKIFEDEDTNPFEEPLLASHLVACTMVQSREPIENSPQINLLIERCHGVLSLIQRRLVARKESNRQLDLAHELSRSNKIFPSIHSVLVISGAILFKGGKDTLGIQSIAATITELTKSGEYEVMHPCIMEALAILGCAKAQDSDTRERLIKCCFLLSGSGDETTI